MTMRASSARSAAGFTLIEILIVLAIISVLSAIAVPQVLGAREKARVAACDDALHAIDSMLLNRVEELEATGDPAAATTTINEVIPQANDNGARNPRNLLQPGYIVSSATVPNLNTNCQVFVYDDTSLRPVIVLTQYSGVVRSFRIALS